MAEPDHNFTHSESSKFNTSKQPQDSYGFYHLTDGFGFTMNMNAPLHQELAEGKRKHDGVRDHALNVLKVHQLKTEEYNLHRARKLELKKIALQQKLQKERIAQAKDIADAKIEIEKLQQTLPDASVQHKPYHVKQIGKEQMEEIKAALGAMDPAQMRQVMALVLKEYPDSQKNEDGNFDFDPASLSAETQSKIHDLVQRHFPDLVSATATSAAADGQPVTPAPCASSPTISSPRNHIDLRVNVPASSAPISAIPPHIQSGERAPAPNPLNPGLGASKSTLDTSRSTDRKQASAAYHGHPYAAKLLDIHQALKQFRFWAKSIQEGNPQLKIAMNEIRRTITGRLNVLSTNKEGNANAKKIIVVALRNSLTPNCGKEVNFNIPLVDPNNFLVKPREQTVPEPPQTLNAANLPMTFIYGLHILVKATFKKFADECSSDPKKADPVGLLVSSIFAMPEFTWRGESLIDIMVAKFRKDVPVLFGIRGSETTEQGRERIGWRRHKAKDGGQWIDFNEHSNRMTGLAAGFSSIALRDFSRSSTMINPYKPPNWWFAMSAIVGTPDEATSDTQFIVLKYMIDGWESKIFNFYGDKAKMQLYTSIFVFPGKANEKTAAVRAVQALAETLKKQTGLVTDKCPTPMNATFGGFSPVWGPAPPTPMEGISSGPLRAFGQLPTPRNATFRHISAGDDAGPAASMDQNFNLPAPALVAQQAPQATRSPAWGDVSQMAVHHHHPRRE